MLIPFSASLLIFAQGISFSHIFIIEAEFRLVSSLQHLIFQVEHTNLLCPLACGLLYTKKAWNRQFHGFKLQFLREFPSWFLRSWGAYLSLPLDDFIPYRTKLVTGELFILLDLKCFVLLLTMICSLCDFRSTMFHFSF